MDDKFLLVTNINWMRGNGEIQHEKEQNVTPNEKLLSDRQRNKEVRVKVIDRRKKKGFTITGNNLTSNCQLVELHKVHPNKLRRLDCYGRRCRVIHHIWFERHLNYISWYVRWLV